MMRFWLGCHQVRRLGGKVFYVEDTYFYLQNWDHGTFQIMRLWLGRHQVRRLGGTSADSASWRTRGEEAASRQQIFQKLKNFQPKIYLAAAKYFQAEKSELFPNLRISSLKYIWALEQY